MKITITIDGSDLVDQTEYADWYCSRLDMTRTETAHNGEVRVNRKGLNGTFILPDLTVEWDNGAETDVRLAIIDAGYTSCECEEDFDVREFVWGDDEAGRPVLWGLG